MHLPGINQTCLHIFYRYRFLETEPTFHYVARLIVKRGVSGASGVGGVRGVSISNGGIVLRGALM